jgi:hypothetical protein
MYPGATTFVRTPRGPNSSAMLFENPMSPYLVVQYTLCMALGLMPLIELTLTKLAPGARCGIAALVTLNTPFRFTETSLSQYSSDVSSSGIDVGFMPAQLKTWFSGPSFSTTAKMKALTSLEDDTSTSSW